jgi:hypothetical protein
VLCSGDIGKAWDCRRCIGDGGPVDGRQRTEQARRRLGCGWLAGSTPDDLPELLDPFYAEARPKSVGYCPGYLVRLPGVVEAAEAAEAAEAGVFDSYAPNPDNVQVTGAIAVKRAQAQFQLARAKERKMKAAAAEAERRAA